MFKEKIQFFIRFAGQILFLATFMGCLWGCQHIQAQAKLSDIAGRSARLNGSAANYQGYIDFFEEVYAMVVENYYQPIKREDYDRFIQQFDTKIFAQLTHENKSSDFIRWRSAAFLIDYLKSSEDIFSAFFPPKPAKEYEEEVLGKRHDLGIEGILTRKGYEVTQVEPRSNAYVQGLRIQDAVLTIDDQEVSALTSEEIKNLLMPLEGNTVVLQYRQAISGEKKRIDVTSHQYFKQTVFAIPTEVPGIYALEIQRFNRKTSEDMVRFLSYFKNQGAIKGLILDLRNNPGGPPLAAREISSFFLPPGEDFAYFQHKGDVQSPLDVPTIPEDFHYRGPMVILINEKSGSASELFSGVMQRRGRAVLMGENSAGQVMLKSMFHLKDDSMVLLVTARGHHPDGQVFSFKGLVPDRALENIEGDLFRYAVTYLVYLEMQKQGSPI